MSLDSADLVAAACNIRFDPTVRQSTIRCLSDWIGCTLGGAVSKAADVARATVGPSGGPATIIGWNRSASARDAAFVNAVAGHALDYDDENVWLFGHPAATIVPAVLAVSEEHHATLGQVLRSIAVGYEAAAILGVHANPGHYLAGWHASATLGTLAATVACADLLGFGADRSATGLTMASVQSSGLRVVFGSDVKAFQVGMASSAAVLAVQLANQVSQEVPEALTTLLAMVGASGAPKAAPQQRAVDTRPAIVDTTFKYHATCGATHCLIEAVAAAVRDNGIDGREICEIRCYVSDLAAKTADVRHPGSLHEAQFSLSYVAALAVSEYPLTPDVLWPPSALTMALHQRCSIQVTDEYLGDHHHPARVEIETLSGKTFGHAVLRARGSKDWPLGNTEMTAKFERMAVPVLGSSTTASVQKLLAEATDDLPIGELTATLACPAAGHGQMQASGTAVIA